MLNSLFAYAATRVAGNVVDGIARRAVWGSLAAVLFLTSFVLALMIGFWTFEPVYGAVPTATAIATGCAAMAVLALAVPAFSEWRKRSAATADNVESSAISEAVSAVDEETVAAVDYFGAIQVVASAFMFGLGAARQLRSR